MSPWGFLAGSGIAYGVASGTFGRILAGLGFVVAAPFLIVFFVVPLNLKGEAAWTIFEKAVDRRIAYRKGVAWLAGRDNPRESDTSLEAIIMRCFAVNLMKTCSIEPERLARDVRYRRNAC